MRDQKESQAEFKQIERYLTHSMDKTECSEFEKLMHEDEHLRKQIAEVKTLVQAVEEQSLRDKLNDFHTEIPSSGNRIKSILLYKHFAIAASITIFIGLGIWMIVSHKNKNEKLFAEYFSPDPGLVTPMGTSSNYEFYRGMVDYKQSNFKVAIKRWENLWVQKPDNDTLNFYLGVSYSALGKSKKSIEYLATATRFPESKFISEAYYYLGLAYLDTGATKEAINSFDKSSEVNARAILKQLK